MQNGDYFLPQQEAPSSHILKFELADYRHLPAYETFTTLLAGSIGLQVVEIELQSIEQEIKHATQLPSAAAIATGVDRFPSLGPGNGGQIL
ncbi:MAG: hypothetical protein KZQ99_17590 [Candidatus Thiodiazotropha sp. (ex Dulcina madagascariensis)]|nr:hypothetical protein [Candidatus Thiodiazotropha sp. (ex Dulcina madagascariensis)]